MPIITVGMGLNPFDFRAWVSPLRYIAWESAGYVLIPLISGLGFHGNYVNIDNLQPS